MSLGELIPIRIRAAHDYVSPRQRELTPEEAHVREVAYSLKNKGSPFLAEAGAAMAKLIRESHVILVPVPSTTTGQLVNLGLCNAIWACLPKEQDVGVETLVVNDEPLDSQCMRHKRGDSPRSEVDFRFTAHPAIEAVRQAFPDHGLMFVDNVVTSGNTLRACARAIGAPGAFGLVWADARGTLPTTRVG